AEDFVEAVFDQEPVGFGSPDRVAFDQVAVGCDVEGPDAGLGAEDFVVEDPGSEALLGDPDSALEPDLVAGDFDGGPQRFRGVAENPFLGRGKSPGGGRIDPDQVSPHDEVGSGGGGEDALFAASDAVGFAGPGTADHRAGGFGGPNAGLGVGDSRVAGRVE